MWMRISKVVLTRVADINDVSDAKGLDYVCFSRMMPVAQVQTTWKDLIWIVVRVHWTRNDILAFLIKAMVRVES